MMKDEEPPKEVYISYIKYFDAKSKTAYQILT